MGSEDDEVNIFRQFRAGRVSVIFYPINSVLKVLLSCIVAYGMLHVLLLDTHRKEIVLDEPQPKGHHRVQ